MAAIHIDTSQLTYPQFYIPGTAAGVLDGSSPVAVALDPGTYGFQQQGGVLADFTFRVGATGTIDYDARCDGFLSGRGTGTLTVRGFAVVLDTTPLSHGLVPTLFGSTALAQDKTHSLRLVPAPAYGFISAGGVVADFTFAIRTDGSIALDPRFSVVAEVSGHTLKVNGSRFTLDTHQLSHSLVPLFVGWNGGTLLPGRHELRVLPGLAGYSFISAGGVPTDFTLTFDGDANVIVDPRYAAFAEANGATLMLTGYTITVDTRTLSHGVVPLLLDWAGGHLPPGLHDLTIVPGLYGYSFISAGGIVAGFTLMIGADGTVAIESDYSGFGAVSDRTVTLTGYGVTLDTRALSHAVVPLLLDWAGGHLSPGLHELSVLPGSGGYRFISAGGIVADFALSFNRDGSIEIPPRYAGFSRASGRTLTVAGYKVSLDLSELNHDVFPQILDFSGGLLSPGVHELTMMPASGYTLVTPGGAHPPIPFNLDTAGITTLIDAPAGVTAMSGGRFCGVPDSIATPLQILTYGASGGRWSRGNLSVSIDLTNAPDLGPAVTPTQVIQAAFAQWQVVLLAFFRFNFVPSGGDIQVMFGSTELDKRFGSSGGVLGTGQYPENGRLCLDRHEVWTPALLQSIVLHEIGHVLGLEHSDNPQSLMYPYVPGTTTIDAETQNFLRNLYGWRPQIPLSDRATSDRPALAVTANTNCTSTILTLRSVWKGSGSDQSVYESALENNVWTPQRLVPGVTSSHSPALTTIPLNNGTPSTGLLMAFKGPGDAQGLFTIRDGFSGWTAPERVPNVGTSRRPALANFNGVVHMAWKGAGSDQGIYWSRLRPTGWEPQAIVRGVGTSEAPALAVFQNRLFMFWKGIEGDSRVYYTSRELGDDRVWAPQRLVEYADTETTGSVFVQIASSRGPSVTPHVNRLLLTWKGLDGDQGIYFSFFDGASFTGQIRVADVGTSEGPGVCRIGTFSHMLWKGVAGDNVIYWSTLPD